MLSGKATTMSLRKGRPRMALDTCFVCSISAWARQGSVNIACSLLRSWTLDKPLRTQLVSNLIIKLLLWWLQSRQEVACTDAVPSCGQTCGRVLSCGHVCEERCGTCPENCRVKVLKQCSCGAQDRLLPCSESFR